MKYCAEEVNMCQGSKYRKDMRKYRPIVEAVETMRLVKTLLPIFISDLWLENW